MLNQRILKQSAAYAVFFAYFGNIFTPVLQNRFAPRSMCLGFLLALLGRKVSAKKTVRAFHDGSCFA
jgi:hypothetical protein